MSRNISSMSESEQKREIIYGLHSVFGALDAGRRVLDRVYIVAGEKVKNQHQKILKLAAKREVPVERISGFELEKLTGSSSHQGAALRAGAYPFIPLQDILAAAPAGSQRLLLIIDGVTDPHNLGALVRTAACVGVSGIIIPKDNAASPTPAVSKASAGTLEYVSLARETNIARTVDFLKKRNIWVAGLAADAAGTIYDSNLTGSMALVVGGEERGIRRLVRAKCDFLGSIPQVRTVDSLNVSVAGGVALYELYRQRIAAGQGGSAAADS